MNEQSSRTVRDIVDNNTLNLVKGLFQQGSKITDPNTSASSNCSSAAQGLETQAGG